MQRGLNKWVMASPLSWYKRMPTAAVSIWPQSFSFCSLKTNFSLLNLNFLSLHCVNKAIRFLLGSARAPVTRRSSAFVVHASEILLLHYMYERASCIFQKGCETLLACLNLHLSSLFQNHLKEARYGFFVAIVFVKRWKITKKDIS